MNKKRLLVLVLLLAAAAAFFVFGLQRYVSLAFFESQRAASTPSTPPTRSNVAIYWAVYVAVTALSLPGAVPMTLVGGALFGFWLGTLLVSFASTIGATLAFLAARLVLRDWVQERFGERLSAVTPASRRKAPSISSRCGSFRSSRSS